MQQYSLSEGFGDIIQGHVVKDKWGEVVCVCHHSIDANKIVSLLNSDDEQKRKKQEW